jgi:predicted nucleic acid-binding protein
MGKPLGPFDTQIAAHALLLAATVVSHDGDFRLVAGLPVEDWATDL